MNSKLAKELVLIAKSLIGTPVQPRSKRVRLTPSEIANADVSYGGRRYTIIRRPQKDGRFWVAAIGVDDGKVILEEYAEDVNGVRMAISEINRWMDKLAMSGPMSVDSRHRR